MKITAPIFALLCALVSALFAQPARNQAADNDEHPVLLTQKLALREASEVGLEIEARSPDASWAHKGAEAAALAIIVDGARNQDLLLWAGEALFTYRVLLGRLEAGEHTITIVLDEARSAKNARRAEVKAARPLIFDRANGEEALAIAYAPMLYARANSIDRFTDVPLLIYYEAERRPAGLLRLRYSAIFSNEDGGTPTVALMARWGRATDIEWIYEVSLRDGEIIEESYQGVEHETKPFTGERARGRHPLLAIASDNNNFSDLACSKVLFAPLPMRADLNDASRESLMDANPWTYRIMAEELRREGRIADMPTDINTIADPRAYLYIEARAAQRVEQIAFDVRLKGVKRVFSSDMGDDRLRVDRAGYFRVAVLLPKRFDPRRILAVGARCGNETCGDDRVRVVKLVWLDENYEPHAFDPPSR